MIERVEKLRQTGSGILAGLLLKQHLDNRQCASVEAVCTDMLQAYVNAVHQVLPKAAIVYDKFHVSTIGGKQQLQFFALGTANGFPATQQKPAFASAD